MSAESTSLSVCPSCGTGNIAGTDRCESCLLPLRSLDVPDADQAISESPFSQPLSEVRLDPLTRVNSGTLVTEVVSILRDAPAGAVMVIDGEELLGIVTERDILNKVAARDLPVSTRVTEIMTPDPVVLREGDSVSIALNKMGVGGFRHVPLVNDSGKVLGTITGPRLLRWVFERYFD